MRWQYMWRQSAERQSVLNTKEDEEQTNNENSEKKEIDLKRSKYMFYSKEKNER